MIIITFSSVEGQITDGSVGPEVSAPIMQGQDTVWKLVVHQ